MDVRLDHKESWASKNWCFWTVVLEMTLESSLDCKEIKPVNPKGNQSWIFIGRTDAEAPILWPPDAKSWLTRKDPDVGKDWRQEEKGTTEDEMVGQHHRLDGQESEQVPGVGDGQGGLVCCSPWGLRESDTTEWLNWTELDLEANYYKLSSLFSAKIQLTASMLFFLYIALGLIMPYYVLSCLVVSSSLQLHGL